MVVIDETGDGNFQMTFDWAIPETVLIEAGEIQLLQDELNRMFPERVNGG